MSNKIYICDRQKDCKDKSFCGTLCTTTSDPNHAVKKPKATFSLASLLERIFKKRTNEDLV